MLLSDLLKNVQYEIINGSDCQINNLVTNTNEEIENNLFICITGLRFDSHNAIPQLIEKGVSAIVIDKNIEINNTNATIVKVADSRKALSIISSNFYGNPANFMKFIGLTGTNGKTSTAYFIENILYNYQKKVGLISTIDVRINKEVQNLHFTTASTPDSHELQKILNVMHSKNCEYLVMEVTSHALAMDRVYGINYPISGFTNLTPEHLDVHINMNNYLNEKIKLFKQSNLSIINIDDEYAEQILSNKDCNFLTYGVEKDCDYKAYDVKLNQTNVEYKITIEGKELFIKVPLSGIFTVYNSLLALSISHKLGVPLDIIESSLNTMTTIKGRMQQIENNFDFNIIIDYAHTPDSFEKVLKAARDFSKENIYCLFGCGGDRDASKRPVMGNVAATYSDKVCLTTDNPRTEKPEKIIEDIVAGIEDKSKINIILDRKEAIKQAILNLKPNDTLLILGKGHETYQIIGTTKYPFKEEEIVQEILKGM